MSLDIQRGRPVHGNQSVIKCQGGIKFQAEIAVHGDDLVFNFNNSKKHKHNQELISAWNLITT